MPTILKLQHISSSLRCCRVTTTRTTRAAAAYLSTKAAVQQQKTKISTSRAESFLSGSMGVYAEQMLNAWKKNPNSVHASWAAYFTNLELNPETPEGAFTPLSSIQYDGTPKVASQIAPPPSDSLGVSHLIRAYQVNGHLAARLDPLDLHCEASFPYRPVFTNQPKRDSTDKEPNFNMPIPSLNLDYHGFTKDELDRNLNLLGRSAGGNKGYLNDLALLSPTDDIEGHIKAKPMTLRKILKQLQETYCGTLGVEYMHIGNSEKCNWIRDRLESPKWLQYSPSKKQHIYERLVFADVFENFLAQKFNTTKRFGLDGGEAVVPGLKALIDHASAHFNASTFIIGMPHRGRLNVLANVMRKPMPLIFSEFQGTAGVSALSYHGKSRKNEKWGISGDVKYHLGTSMDRTYPDGTRIHLSLLANPSHLECVNPLVAGKARAKQFYGGNRPEHVRNVVPILLHGDAAFAGQGVVYETMQLSQVEDFHVGGTIHVVVNNQIGFTTNPNQSRSTPYCSDLGKAFDCPIFHCNGDDPLAVCTAFETAAEYRAEWGTDVVIDVVCYRRNGHNELDQPAFTQPKLYELIRKHPSTADIFEKKLLDDGVITKEEVADIKDMVWKSYEDDFQASKDYQQKETDWLAHRWKGFKSPRQLSRIRETGYDIETLRRIGVNAGKVPDGFKLHRQMEKIFKARREMAESGENIDWGTAESMAFGSLLMEGNHVRLTGQDVQRGTFSHRHAVVKDQATEEEYTPLNALAKHLSPSAPLNELALPDTQAQFTCRNSILSEFAVLGFELGYSLENPNSLVIWEAQFGDFSNGAQIMIDQFISSGEDKWLRQSGLVMLLPHGYDGQGAEHSSCRIERFLQMVDEDPDYIPDMAQDSRMQIQRCNWQVVNCSTPASYFHCLRRQVHRDFRKPLIVASPKNLLRHKRCVSKLEEMGPGTMFHRVLGEQDPAISSNPAGVKTLVFCTGQIYYELLAEREKQNRSDVALVRLEQIAPFAFDRVAENVALYPNAEVVWAQQEPKNMGAYSYVEPRIRTAARDLNQNEKLVRYVGRNVSAAPATGVGKIHQEEYQEILDGVFGY